MAVADAHSDIADAVSHVASADNVSDVVADAVSHSDIAVSHVAAADIDSDVAADAHSDIAGDHSDIAVSHVAVFPDVADVFLGADIRHDYCFVNCPKILCKFRGNVNLYLFIEYFERC